MRPARDDVIWSLAAIVLLGLGTSNNNGHWSMLSFAIVSSALVVMGWRFAIALAAGGPASSREGESGSAGGAQRYRGYVVLALLATMPATALLDGRLLPPAALARFGFGRGIQGLSLVLLATYLPFLRAEATAEPERRKTTRFAVFGALLFLAGVMAIRVSPEPDIDVWTIQERAAQLVLQGKNPYVWIAVPTSDRADDFTVVYNYPPISIYLALLGRCIGGDPRYGMLASMIVAGVALRVIARTGRSEKVAEDRPALFDDAPALAFWLWSPLLFVLDRAWIDPLQVALLASAVAAYVRRWETLAAAVLGVALSSKQSMFWLVPLAFALLRFDVKRWAALAAGALVPLLPFMVWDLARLKHNLFDFMAGLGPRHDALCFTAFVHHAFGAEFPHQIGFALGAIAVGIAWWRRPARTGDVDRTAHALAFAQATAVTYYLFFFFNRWMFANYYCTVAGFVAITAAVAAARRADERAR